MNYSNQGHNTSPSSPYSHRRIFFLIPFIVFCLAACGGGSGSTPIVEQEPPSADKPNILLIMVDDLGFNDLAINNENTEIDTPNLDKIANDGVRFTRHYAHTVCSPARAALLTGLSAERLGYLPNGRGISPEVVTLPEVLKDEGYTTWHIGKWHIGDLERTAWPDHQGFDHWFGFLNQWRLAGMHTADGEIELATPRYNDPWLEGDSEAGKYYSGHLENILTDKAMDVLTDLNQIQAPWFLNLWYYAPHVPIQPASEFAINYPDTKAGKYQALVNQLDYNIGRVISHLETIGALQNTIIVIVSDNGGTNSAFDNNFPFFGQKATMTEGALRTPLIIRWPEESVNGRVISDIVSIADIYPTLLESIGVAPPENLDGKSFYRSVQQLDPPSQKTLFWELGPRAYGALSSDGQWRLYSPAWYLGVELMPLLYNFDVDPTATQEIIPIPIAQLTQMMAGYDAWYREVHTVKTAYIEGANGSGILTGMDFLRTPGFGPYTFGIAIPHELDGPIAKQVGIWEMSRSGNTVMAQFGDITLSGEIVNTSSCHSIVISGIFYRNVRSSVGLDLITLALYIDGIETQSGEIETALAVPDPTVETIIGDPGNALGVSTLTPPVILNTALETSFAWTPESFSQDLCNGI